MADEEKNVVKAAVVENDFITSANKVAAVVIAEKGTILKAEEDNEGSGLIFQMKSAPFPF
jgi:hypothetical protein